MWKKMIIKGSQKVRFMTVSKKGMNGSNPVIKLLCFKIRPILEYAFQVWSPGLTVMQKHDIE